MNILVVDVGGTHVKILATGHEQPRRFPSGPTLTAEQMVARVIELAGDWQYDVVSIGYPGFVMRGRPVAEPHNLAPGWVGFDFQAAFGCPVKLINDAAMQALGSYRGGKMLLRPYAVDALLRLAEAIIPPRPVVFFWPSGGRHDAGVPTPYRCKWEGREATIVSTSESASSARTAGFRRPRRQCRAPSPAAPIT
jgi:hypothetical protein